MSKLFEIGDKVKIKDRPDWPSPPGYRLANLKGQVVVGFGMMDPSEEPEIFSEFIKVQLDNNGTIVTLRSNALEKAKG